MGKIMPRRRTQMKSIKKVLELNNNRSLSIREIARATRLPCSTLDIGKNQE